MGPNEQFLNCILCRQKRVYDFIKDSIAWNLTTISVCGVQIKSNTHSENAIFYHSCFFHPIFTLWQQNSNSSHSRSSMLCRRMFIEGSFSISRTLLNENRRKWIKKITKEKVMTWRKTEQSNCIEFKWKWNYNVS